MTMTNWVSNLTPESYIAIVDHKKKYVVQQLKDSLIIDKGVVIGIFISKFYSIDDIINGERCPIKQFTIELYDDLIQSQSNDSKTKFIQANLHQLLVDYKCIEILISMLHERGSKYKLPRELVDIPKPLL